MKPTRMMLVVMAIGLVALPGCRGEKTEGGTAIRQGSPKEALETFAIAMDKDDFDAVPALIEPAYSKPMKTMADAMKASKNKLKELAKAVESKIGKDAAKVVHDAIKKQSGGDDKVKKVLTNGKLDESKVEIKIDGDKATATIKGETSKPLALVKVDGKWYVKMPDMGDKKPEDVQKMADTMKGLVDGETKKIDELTKQVKDGTVGKDKFAEEFGKISVGF